MDINNLCKMNKVGTISIVEIDNDGVRVILSTSKPNVLIKTVLLLLGSFCVLFPLSILFVPQISVGFSYFAITIPLFGGSAVFFFRMLLWNYYGREVFELSETSLLQYNDYKLFKDNKKNIPFKSLQVGYAMLDNPNQVLIYPNEFKPDKKVFLGLVLDGNIICSGILIYSNDIKHLTEILKARR